MIYRTFEGVSKNISALIYGTASMPFLTGDENNSFERLDMAFSYGVNTIDTGHAYGSAESVLGKWLESRANREEICLVDKGCNPGQKGCPDVMSASLIREQNKESLQRLRTDYVDFYVLHRDDESVPVGAVVEVLNELKEAGKIRRFGASNWRRERIAEANEYASAHQMEGFSVVSPAYSLAVVEGDPWGGSVRLSGDDRETDRRWYREHKMPIFAYSSLARGYLSGKYRTDCGREIADCLDETPIIEYDSRENRTRLHHAEIMAEQKNCTVSAVCLAWLLRQNLDVYPIIGPGSAAHMEESLKALEVQLTPEEIEWMYRV